MKLLGIGLWFYTKWRINGTYTNWRIKTLKGFMIQLGRTPKQIDHVLQRYRRLAALSQAELAAKAGIRQATVSQIENGHEGTRIGTICDLLAALDLEFTIAPRSKGSSQDIEDIF